MKRVDAEKQKEIARQKMRIAKDKIKIAKNPPPFLVPSVEFTGDAEVDSKLELDALQTGFRERMKAESKRFELATDSEYWACICFQSREQKEHFLSALKILEFGDKYLDGQLVAEKLGLKLPPCDIKYKVEPKVNAEWLSFVEGELS